MKKIMWGTHDIKELSFNTCHLGLCDGLQRKKCDTKQECLTRLCGDDEKKIGEVSIFKDYEYGDKTSKKIDKAIDKWRKESYKKCRPILMIIKRHRGKNEQKKTN